MPPGHSEEDKELLTKRSSVELIKNYETQRRRKDGKIIDISLTISPIKDSSEKIIGSSTIARDISEKKKLESVVVNAKNTAEATNKELEAFSYSVSHDLRAPLRSIDGFSQALLEDYSGKLDATGRNYLDKIRKATQHMGLLIDDMLKLSRVTRAEFKRESVDLSKMVRAIILTLRQNNPARDVKISIQKDIIIDGDRYLLEIALTNLIDNAWKFTGKQKHPHVEFGATLKENEKIFFIRDNGVGFDMSYVGKLFGAFQRLHTADEFAGTGIGLATVQRIINRHGGKIWAEGEVGKGATFYFTIP
jgi:light-regulated signal transduction histidine kinase (bacteriophytochrome)